jgi:hypothetical protein
MNSPAPIEGGGLLEPPSSMGPFPSRRPSASVEGGGGAWEVKRENGGGGSAMDHLCEGGRRGWMTRSALEGRGTEKQPFRQLLSNGQMRRA